MIARLALAGLTLAAALNGAAEGRSANPPEGTQAAEAAPAEPAATPVERKGLFNARKVATVKAEAAGKEAAEPVAAEAPEVDAKPEAKPTRKERAALRRAAKAKPGKVEADPAAAKAVEAAAVAPGAAVEPPAGQPVAGEPASAPVEATVAEPEPKGHKAKRSARAKRAPSHGGEPTEAVSVEAAQPEEASGRDGLDTLIAAHAKANGLRESFVHRVIRIESRHNPKAVGRGGVYGLMQIKTPTARALGYAGGPAGLLDADTNLTYGVRYLAGAYKVAGGDETRAYAFYRSGYYYAAKRKGLGKGEPAPVTVAAAEPPAERASLSSLWTPVSANAADPGR
jgi:soluble lytic murein transglycosylase-like protein